MSSAGESSRRHQRTATSSSHSIIRSTMRSTSVTRDGSLVAGKISLEENETRFRFHPDGAWAPSRYAIRVDGVIEDLAGNRLGKLFDVDTSDSTQSSSATPHAEIAFDVSAR
jgi:hypothetical protein